MKKTDDPSQSNSLIGVLLIVCIITWLFTFFAFDASGFPSGVKNNNNNQFYNFENETKWSYTLQAGWATNIDFALTSGSLDYRFDGNSTGINAKFDSYDSREKISEFEGDQANNYLLTIKNETSGFTFTTGVIHDKREQRPNVYGNIFRYEKGGMSPVIMIGHQHDFTSTFLRNVSLQFKAGCYLNYDKINVVLINEERKISYTATNENRTFSGGGVVAMAIISYSYYISDSWSFAFLINGTLMAGNAFTKADAFNEVSEEVSTGKLSVNYSSLSLGPSLGLTFIR